MDKVSRALYLENRATAVQAEREAAAKAVESADKSVRKGEKEAVVGAAKGLGAGIAEGAAWVLDVLLSNPKYQFGSDKAQFEQELRTYFDSKMKDKTEAEKSGYSFGKVVSNFIDPGPGAELGAAAAGVKKVLSKEDELRAIIKSQASDAKAWQKQGGGKPSAAVRDEYAKQGLDYEGRKDPETGKSGRGEGLEPVYQARVGEKQESAFPSKQSEPIYEMQDEHPVLVGDKEDQQMLEYSQAQHDPGATAGLEPQKPAPFGETMESIRPLAAARTKRWAGGKFDPVTAEKDWARVLQQRKADASKGKGAAGAAVPAKYWVFDESDKTIYEVLLNKDGKVITRPSKADWRWKDKDTGEFVRDQNGKVMVRPEIDEIVPKGAKGFIEAKRDRLAVEEFQASQARLSPTEAPPRDLTKWDADAGDKAVYGLGPGEWDGMTEREREQFVKEWLANDLLPELPNLKKKK